MATEKDKNHDKDHTRPAPASQTQQQRAASGAVAPPQPRTPAQHPAEPQHHVQEQAEPRHPAGHHPEPPHHPAQPPEAKPGVPQQDLQPKLEGEAEKPPEEKVLEKDDAMQLFHAGHRLKVKGDPPEKWFAASRIANQLVICKPVDEEIEKFVMEHELVRAD